MVKRILTTRPHHDLTTEYLHEFSKEIVRTLRVSKDIHLTDLEGSKAVRLNVEDCLKKENPELVFLNGHGNKKQVAGHKDEIILDNQNLNLIKDKIVYALSCDSLEDLGEDAVAAGAKAYIGYRAKFMIVQDPSRTPAKDKNALPFKRACCTLINALVFGMSVEKAIAMTKEEYRDSIRSYGNSEDDPYGDTPLIRFALAWNLEFLDMCGDPNATF